ncbi:hypothetical protein LTR27_010713 [Elasticomyces elasticus]|nr:hypothetical protein LTR27_010713 [Elasticomyces elasticus]
MPPPLPAEDEMDIDTEDEETTTQDPWQDTQSREQQPVHRQATSGAERVGTSAKQFAKCQSVSAQGTIVNSASKDYIASKAYANGPTSSATNDGPLIIAEADEADNADGGAIGEGADSGSTYHAPTQDNTTDDDAADNESARSHVAGGELTDDDEAATSCQVEGRQVESERQEAEATKQRDGLMDLHAVKYAVYEPGSGLSVRDRITELLPGHVIYSSEYDKKIRSSLKAVITHRDDLIQRELSLRDELTVMIKYVRSRGLESYELKGPDE